MRPILIALLITAAVSIIQNAGAQTSMNGQVTIICHPSKVRLIKNIEIKDFKVPDHTAPAGVVRIATVIFTEDGQNGAPEHDQSIQHKLFITQSGDTKSNSLIGFFIDRGYVTSIRVDTWEKDKPFQMWDTWTPRWDISGKINRVSF